MNLLLFRALLGTSIYTIHTYAHIYLWYGELTGIPECCSLDWRKIVVEAPLKRCWQVYAEAVKDFPNAL